MKAFARAIPVVVAGALLLVPSGASRAQEDEDEAENGVAIEFRKNYYPIEGVTWPQLWRAIRRAGITIGSDTRKFEGVTSYSYSLSPASRCSSANSQITVELHVNVPGLAPATRLADGDQRCWARYERWLADHEEGHVRIAHRDAKALIAQIRSSAGATCDRLQRLARNGFAAMETTQRNYDRISDHGNLQWRLFGLDRNPDRDDAALWQSCVSRAEQD